MSTTSSLSSNPGLPQPEQSFDVSLSDGVSLLRPLLAVPRSLARGYLESCGQPWREDATNADVRYARNFLRHEILPRCESGPYPAAAASLVRLGGQAARRSQHHFERAAYLISRNTGPKSSISFS
jgi:tRNA(Ile)-lysidine synthase